VLLDWSDQLAFFDYIIENTNIAKQNCLRAIDKKSVELQYKDFTDCYNEPVNKEVKWQPHLV